MVRKQPVIGHHFIGVVWRQQMKLQYALRGILILKSIIYTSPSSLIRL